jgi:hypothetical protein
VIDCGQIYERKKKRVVLVEVEVVACVLCLHGIVLEYGIVNGAERLTELSGQRRDGRRLGWQRDEAARLVLANVRRGQAGLAEGSGQIGRLVGQLLAQLLLLLEHNVREYVGEGDDALDAILRVHHNQAVHLLVDNALHDCRQGLRLLAAGDAVEAVAPVLERVRHRYVQVVVGLLGRQILD